jgi:hypothetical protein
MVHKNGLILCSKLNSTKMSRNYSELFDVHEAMMLQDADSAITQCNLWEWLRDYTPEEGKGFMFSEHPNLVKINAAMKFGGHSGSSYGWTMRQMEYIAKHGWTLFEFTRRNQNTASVLRKVKTADPSPLDIAEASRGVPGFEGQADAMKRFSEGKMTYAEMRSLCG